jgi:serine/threonine protein kinase
MLRRTKGAQSDFFPGFTDIAEIGIGSLATVYRAREVGTNRLVALKLLNVRDASPRAIESFERESIALGAVSSHPNIVTLYRSFRAADGRPVLVLELCRGAISDRTVDGQGLGVAEVVSLGIKIAGALETAHRAEILHRDVKPQNILITEFGEPALADFGVAMLQSSTQTTAGLFDFTTLHAAPELLEGGETSAATDVYELASSIYQLIAGKSAFRAYDGESPASVILRILRDPVQPLVNAHVSTQLSDLLVYAMSKDKDSRPPTAAEFAAELATVEAEQGWPRTQFLIRDPNGSAVGLPSITRLPQLMNRNAPPVGLAQPLPTNAPFYPPPFDPPPFDPPPFDPPPFDPPPAAASPAAASPFTPPVPPTPWIPAEPWPPAGPAAPPLHQTAPAASSAPQWSPATTSPGHQPPPTSSAPPTAVPAAPPPPPSWPPAAPYPPPGSGGADAIVMRPVEGSADTPSLPVPPEAGTAGWSQPSFTTARAAVPETPAPVAAPPVTPAASAAPAPDVPAPNLSAPDVPPPDVPPPDVPASTEQLRPRPKPAGDNEAVVSPWAPTPADWSPPAPNPESLSTPVQAPVPTPAPPAVADPTPLPAPDPGPLPGPDPLPVPAPEPPLAVPAARRPIRIDEDDNDEADDAAPFPTAVGADESPAAAEPVAEPVAAEPPAAEPPAPSKRAAAWLATDLSGELAISPEIRPRPTTELTGETPAYRPLPPRTGPWGPAPGADDPLQYPIRPAAGEEGAAETRSGPVPTWAFRAPSPTPRAATSPAFVGDLSLDPASLRRRVTLRSGPSALIVDESKLVLRSWWRRRNEIAWSDVHGFEPRFDGANVTTGRLVALTRTGPVELPATKRSSADLRYLHALLDAYRQRAAMTADR